jgi:hypothetical protein
MKSIRKILIALLVIIPVIAGALVSKSGLAQISSGVTITPEGALSAQVNIPFSITFRAGGGEQPYQWASNLPDWLDYFPKDDNGFCVSEQCTSQNPDSIQISGTPPAPGNYNIELATLDSLGNTGTETFNLSVTSNNSASQEITTQNTNNNLLQFPADSNQNQTTGQTSEQQAQVQQNQQQSNQQTDQISELAEQFLGQYEEQSGPINIGTSFTYNGSPAAYYLTDAGKELYSSMAILDAWNVKITDVVTISKNQQYQDSPKVVVSLPSGKVVKVEKSPTVYEVVSGHTLRAFPSLSSFNKSGYNINDIITLKFSELFPYYQVIE